MGSAVGVVEQGKEAGLADSVLVSSKGISNQLSRPRSWALFTWRKGKEKVGPQKGPQGRAMSNARWHRQRTHSGVLSLGEAP